MLHSQTPWLGANNAPNWGPARPLIVTDPRKLTYFARANMVRAGVQGSYGALQGFGRECTGTPCRSLQGFGDIVGNRIVPGSIATEGAVAITGKDNLGRNFTFDPETIYGDVTASGSAGSSTTADPNGTSTVDQFFSRLNQLVSPAPVYSAPVQPSTPWLAYLAAGLAVVGVVVVGKKLLKK